MKSDYASNGVEWRRMASAGGIDFISEVEHDSAFQI